MGNIRRTAPSFGVCSRLRLRAEVIRPGSSSRRRDGREFRATRGPEDQCMHSHPDSGSLNQKSVENNLSHTHMDKHTVRIRASIFQSVFGCNICVRAVSISPPLLTYSGALVGFEGCVCVRAVEQEAIVEI